MQETISNSVMNGNTLNLLVVAGIIIFVTLSFIFCLKSRLISIGTPKIKVGMSEQVTRDLIRQQFDYVANAIQMFVALMPRDEGFNEDKAKYVSEKVLDEINRWVVFNHISNNDFYIENKQIVVWNIIQGIGQREEFKTKEFQEQCNSIVLKIIKQLIKIKNYYESNVTND